MIIPESQDKPGGDVTGTGGDDPVWSDSGHHHSEGTVRKTVEDGGDLPQGARQLDERTAAEGQCRGRGRRGQWGNKALCLLCFSSHCVLYCLKYVLTK